MAKTQPNERETKEQRDKPAESQGAVPPGTPGAVVQQPAEGARTAGEPDLPRPPRPIAMGAPGGEGTAQPGEVVPPDATSGPRDTGFRDLAKERQEADAQRQREAIERGLAPVAVLAPGAAAGAAAGLASGQVPLRSGHEPLADDRAAAVGDPEIVPEESGQQVPASGLELLYATCEKYGVNPTWDVQPRELASWRYHGANRRAGTPEAVTIVTAGGVKLKEYADPNFPKDEDTEERLRGIFKSYTFNPNKERVLLPLPDDLTLPAESVDGQVRSTTHVVRAGWRRGARAEAVSSDPQQALRDEANRRADQARRGR